MKQEKPDEGQLKPYLELAPQTIRENFRAIQARSPRKRQEPFNIVETLLCYGLFGPVNPHRYGSKNIDKAPEIVRTLATFFQRPATSITYKMLNLDGTQPNGKNVEPYLYAVLADQPDLYASLYLAILREARNMGLEVNLLPDFLHLLTEPTQPEALLGQYELPNSSHRLLQEAGAQDELEEVDQEFQLGDRLTEKLVERRVRLLQHYFAREVLLNCDHTCVFCGFAPHNLDYASGLLRASHIKSWAASNEKERVDLSNGLAACPMHDAAFDRGYLTVEDTCNIVKARILQESIDKDQGVRPYFSDLLNEALILPANAKKPAVAYLAYHRLYIFHDGASL
ncbi:MAG TPA: HNH endonuclease [Ktedonobacteraceae bacterium]